MKNTEPKIVEKEKIVAEKLNARSILKLFKKNLKTIQELFDL